MTLGLSYEGPPEHKETGLQVLLSAVRQFLESRPSQQGVESTGPKLRVVVVVSDDEGRGEQST